MDRIPIEKQVEHIEAYKKVYPLYEDFATLLKAILAKAKDIYAPMGLVEARAKKIESFSEKIIRKNKYQDPLVDMTDLCGARVITHFSKQVHDICRFIEENFEIDTENSLDLKSRLRTSEFGYRSIHYIITRGMRISLVSTLKTGSAISRQRFRFAPFTNIFGRTYYMTGFINQS